MEVKWHPQATASNDADADAEKPSSNPEVIVVVVNRTDQAAQPTIDIIQSEDAHLVMPSAISDEVGDLNDDMLEKAWQQGFDLRFHLAPSFMIYSVDHEYYHDTALFLGLEGGIEWGYRWKYGGIYLFASMSYTRLVGDGDVPSEDCPAWDVLITGRFFVPISTKLEAVFGCGLGWSDGISFSLTAGLNWHWDHMLMGVELVYQGAFFVEQKNEIRPTFVIGYTF